MTAEPEPPQMMSTLWDGDDDGVANRGQGRGIFSDRRNSVDSEFLLLFSVIL